MNSLNPASHALTRPPSRPSAVRLSLACAFVALLGLAGCGGGGGGGLSSAGPVVLVDGTDRLHNGTDSDGAAAARVTERNNAHIGTPTPGTISDPARYETAEYHAGGRKAPLAATSFSAAYARGWTGRGSVVTIADTGIDENHPDLAPALAGNRDFTGTGRADTNGHGTHVAGIVAAQRDGVGIHGGAFDAQLLVGKVAVGRSYSFDKARQAAAWGRDQDSVAVNVSAAYLRDAFLESRLRRLGDGSYYLDDPWYGYGENGFYGVRALAAGWAAALGPRQVLVKAAGNSGTDYSAAFNQLATATDDSGTLLLNRQMLVVGNWDAAGETIIGNRAGNVCTTWQGGSCRDAARISDSFILAPGTDITSTFLGGGYAAMSGTSMAAPLVSAALAVLRQNWPHLDGNQLAAILLETADRTIPGYEEHIHGQGLLDMDRATQPLGEAGVPVEAGVAGARMPPVVGGAVGGVASMASAALSGVMLLDSYDRDFYIDLAAGLTPADTRRGSLAAAGGLTDAYAGYFEPDQHMAVRLPLGRGLSLIAGAGHEPGGFLGNRLGGLLGNVTGSLTAYGLASLHHPFGTAGVELFGQIGTGVTRLETGEAPALLQQAGTVLSSTASLGISRPAAGGRLGIAVSRPVQMDRAGMRYRLPVSRSRDGVVGYETRKVDFRPAKRETDLGLFFRRGGWQGRLATESFVEWRHDAPHALGETLVEAGVRISLSL